MADADWYALLTEAQAEWYATFATYVPFVLMGAPTAMSTADSGATYTFSSSVYPTGGLEVYDSATGRLLRPAAYWESAGDYVWEGNKIRITKGGTRSFTGGPVARYITPPTTIDGSTAPTLKPDECRILLVHRALIKWATLSALQDPEKWERAEQKAWMGDPANGQVGFLGQLKTQNLFMGSAGYAGGEYTDGLAYLHTVSGYTAI